MNFRKQVLAGILCRKPQDIATAVFDPMRWEPPEFSAQGGDVPVSDFLGQTEFLESQDQVVSPQDHLHVSSIGPEAAGWNLGHCIGALELAQQKLLESPVAKLLRIFWA